MRLIEFLQSIQNRLEPPPGGNNQDGPGADRG